MNDPKEQNVAELVTFVCFAVENLLQDVLSQST